MRATRPLALPVLLAVLLVTASAAQARGHHGRHHGKGRTVFVGPGESIQAAVDAAKPGTTIKVFGHHSENVAITTDRISLVGVHAVLEPAATPIQNACFDPANPTDINGICVLGDVDFSTGEVKREVRGVTVVGFTIRGFSDSGIIAVGAQDATFAGNVADDNDEYGITAFSSTGTKMLYNRASGAGEAGFYIGDSPRANAKLVGNVSTDSLFGVLVRNAEHGFLKRNRIYGNCVGVVVLADAPGPAGFFRLIRNAIVKNTKACPASEDSSVPVSGIGVALVGATGVRITGNAIVGNQPSGETAFQGGVVVVKGDLGTVPTNNHVHGNLIVRNDPDIFWDGSGTGNSFRGNRCDTSVPSGFCR